MAFEADVWLCSDFGFTCTGGRSDVFADAKNDNDQDNVYPLLKHAHHICTPTAL